MRRILAAGAAAGSLLAAPEVALACGGFFCSQDPIDQTGEKIVFGRDETGNLVTYVQVQYQGRAEDFSWVLPVPGVPTLAVGTDQLFLALDQQTTPRFWVNFHEEGVCDYQGYWGDAAADGGGAPTAGGRNEDDGGVTVVSQAAVGPYDSVVLAASDPDALLLWLDTNGYDVTAIGQDLLRLYVDDQHHFVALKLQQDKGVGDLVPIVLTYAEPLPCVPIRLTAVAAQPDMGVTAYVLDDRRAVPLNYFHVRINEARIDWLGYGQNYRDVLSEAVDAAPNGQAFVTEYAGSSDRMRNALWSEGRFDLEALRTTSDPVRYVDAMLSQGFRGSAQLLAWFQRWLPMPQSLRDQGVTDRDFYNCMSCYEAEARTIPFDPAAATADLEATIVEPMRDAQALLDASPYLTRLSTTLSPDEMTTDPYFTYNLELGDVDNVHQAEAYVECGTGGRWDESPVRIVTPDGSVIRHESGWAGYWGGDGSGGDAPTAAEAGPAAAIVEQLGDTGTGTIIEDYRGEIAAKLARDPAPPAAEGCGGCAAGGASGLSGIALAALALVRRRRA